MLRCEQFIPSSAELVNLHSGLVENRDQKTTVFILGFYFETLKGILEQRVEFP